MAFLPDEEPKSQGRFVPDERRAAPKTLWETIKQQAKPDIFNTEHAAYTLGSKVSDATGSPELGFATNVAAQAVPMLVGGGIGGSAAPIMQAGSKDLMQRALKPTLENLKNGNAAKAINTMLEGGYNATKGGVEAMRAQISKLNDEVVTAIANSPATVNKNHVASRLSESLKNFSMQVNPQTDMKVIESAWTKFLEHPLLQGRATMSVQEAQKMKQGTYKQLGDKPYGELAGAEIEAQKQLARGLKEEISAAVPGVAQLNKQESKLFNAIEIAERRALLDGNKNPAGLALLAHNVPAFAAFMADKSALFKSLIARMMNSGAEAIPRTAGQVVGGAVGSQSGKPPQ